VEFLNLGIERVERGAERVRHGVVYRQESGPVRAEDPAVELGIEEGDFEAVGRFEEVAALHRSGKDLREANLHLLEGEPMGARGAIAGRERRRQPRGPAIEERLDVRPVRVDR
jgi:hypothetical protein